MMPQFKSRLYRLPDSGSSDNSGEDFAPQINIVGSACSDRDECTTNPLDGIRNVDTGSVRDSLRSECGYAIEDQDEFDAADLEYILSTDSRGYQCSIETPGGCRVFEGKPEPDRSHQYVENPGHGNGELDPPLHLTPSLEQPYIKQGDESFNPDSLVSNPDCKNVLVGGLRQIKPENEDEIVDEDAAVTALEARQAVKSVIHHLVPSRDEVVMSARDDSEINEDRDINTSERRPLISTDMANELDDTVSWSDEYSPDDFALSDSATNEAVEQNISEMLYSSDIVLDDYNEAPEAAENIELVSSVVNESTMARLAALSLGNKYACSHKMVDILTELFTVRGWNAAKQAVDRELSRGMNADELELAVFLQNYWSGRAEFSQSSGRYMQPTLSWSLALCIIRCFNGYPGSAELQRFMDECQQRWWQSFQLRDEYRSFRDYMESVCNSRYIESLAVPDISLEESGYYEQFEDEYDSRNYTGTAILVMPYERNYRSRIGGQR